MTPALRFRPSAAALLLAVALPLAVGLLLAVEAASARAGVANAGLQGSAANPLTGMPWGNYTGELDEVFSSYRGLQGDQQRLLGLVALRPRMRWFGAWYPDDQAGRVAREYIANVTHGDSRVLVQITIFRLQPWESDACRRLPTPGEQAGYRYWIDAFARAIGSTRVALVLQPDLPFVSCVPGHSQIPLQQVAYAARRFSALPHTTVYIDAGAGDWPTVGEAVAMLKTGGIRYTRGFALNATHYDSTDNEIRFGAAVARALRRAGINGKHFVINTSSNGHGFTYQQYNDPATFDNATVCRTQAQQRCAALGIPPTTDVANLRWRLSGVARALAQRYVDAYLWIGRPWLDNQTDPFNLQRALLLARTSPF